MAKYITHPTSTDLWTARKRLLALAQQAHREARARLTAHDGTCADCKQRERDGGAPCTWRVSLAADMDITAQAMRAAERAS